MKNQTNKSAAVLFFAIVLLISCADGGFAQNIKRQKAANKIKKAESYSKIVEDFVEKREKADYIFAEILEGEMERTVAWKRFYSAEELEKKVEEAETYEIADAWEKDGKIAAVKTTNFSESGDWVVYVDTIFYANGNAAKIDRELRTFNGGVIVNRVFIYDEAGKLLKKTKSYRDLNTQKPLKEKPNFMDVDFETPTKLSDFPFAALLAIDAKKNFRSRNCEKA